MFGMSLSQDLQQQAQAGVDLLLAQLLEELAEIKQFVLLYPFQGKKGTGPRGLCTLPANPGNRRWSELSTSNDCSLAPG
jgi:hypothetical protein